jgi:hypothetical protein
MGSKNTSVFAIYRDRLGVDEATATLRGAGFRHTDISALLQENQGTKDFGHERHTKAPEGAATGGMIGGIVGGVLGWLIGAGALAIPTLDRLAAAGPVVAALAGVGALGAVAAIIGGIVGLGMPEYEARRYQGRIKKGGILVSVHCDSDDWQKRAKELLRLTGAENIGTETESGADFSVSDRPLPRARSVGEPLSRPDLSRVDLSRPDFSRPDEVIRAETQTYRQS